MKPKLIRITTVPISMNIILKGQLSFMNQYFDVIGISGYDKKHFKEIKDREKIKMKLIEMKRLVSPFQDLISLWKLYKFIKKEKPQIVHTHTPKAGLLGMLASKMANVPLKLHTVAGLPLMETHGVKRKILNFTEWLTYSIADKVYPNSNGLKKFILENKFCKSEKLKVILNGSSNGIDVNYFSSELLLSNKFSIIDFRRKLKIEIDDIVCCFVGRLCEEKGVAELVNAFSNLLKNKNYKIKLLLVGPLEKENGYLSKESIEKISVIPEILAVGRHDDVRPYLMISDFFVFPSYREGFPNSVLQAGAMGLPSIVSDINGCNEIISDMVNGLIVPVKNAIKLQKAMDILISDEKLRRRLANCSRENIVKNYDQKLIWNSILNEYNSMLENI